MGDHINIAAALGRVVLVFLLLGGAVSAATAQEASGRELQVLMAEAQQGAPESKYRLGQHYEAQYELGRKDPNAATDHTALLLAYAWFQSAEKSGHGEARYARIATEYALKDVLDDDEYRQAMDSVREWMNDQSPPPPSQRDTAGPEDTTAEDTAAEDTAAEDTAAEDTAAEDTAAEDTQEPPEASTELAAGGEDESTIRNIAQTAEPAPERSAPLQPESSGVAAAPPSEPPAKAKSPDIEGLLARGTSYLEAGDLVSARGFFKLAAEKGSGAAAMLVGVTYDPGYLELVNVVGLRPNPEQAETWYLKAITMENDEAKSRLQTLKQRLAQRAQ